MAILDASVAATGIQIGNNVTTGIVQIAQNSAFSGGIDIGSGSASRAGTINIGINGAGTIKVGNIFAPLELSGYTISITGTTSVTTLDGTTTGTTMNVGSNLTNGLILIGNNSAFTGTISIGSNSSTRAGTINIGTLGSGTITIGNSNAPLILNGSSVTFNGTTRVGTLDATGDGTVLNIGSNLTTGSIYIANNSSFSGIISIGSNSSTRTNQLNIGTLGSGPIGIGNADAALTLSGSTTTFSSPLTLGSLPTTTGHLGAITTAGGAVATISSGNGFWTLNIPTTGIYFISFIANFSTTGSVVTSATCVLSGTNVPATTTSFVGGPTNLTGSFAICGSVVVNCTESAYNLSASWTGGGLSATFISGSSYYQASRIA